MNKLEKITILVAVAVIVLAAAMLTAAHGAHAQGTWSSPVTRGGDTALFQDVQNPGADDRVVLVPPGTSDTVICSYRSSAGNCYRFGYDGSDGLTGAMVILLHSLPSFENTGPDQFSSARRSSFANACEISEVWSSWQAVGTVPTTPGATYTEERFCTTGATGGLAACACSQTRETRTATVPGTPPPNCNYGNWTPAPSTQLLGVTFTQIRTLLSGDPLRCTGPFSQTATGTAQACDYGDWSPDRDTVAAGQPMTQTRTLDSGDPALCTNLSRQTTGTRAACAYSSWTPAASTIDDGVIFTQTRSITSGDSSYCTDPLSRQETGTKPPAPPPPPCNVNWSPDPYLYCTTEQFTQSRERLVGNACQVETRDIFGTRTDGRCDTTPPPIQSCRYGSWSPATSTVTYGQSFTQTRPVTQGEASRCTDTTQTATGTMQEACVWSSWSPAASTVAYGQSFTQRRSLTSGHTAYCSGSTSQQATGTRQDTCSYSSWSPAASTVTYGQSFTQSRSLQTGHANYCSGPYSQSATGSRRDACAYSNWTPAISTVPAGESFTQSRSLTSGHADYCLGPYSQTATGTKPWDCSVGEWAPSTDSVTLGQQFTQTRPVLNGADPRYCPPLSRTATGTMPIVIQYTMQALFILGSGNQGSDTSPGVSCQSGDSGSWFDGTDTWYMSCLPAT